MPRLRGARGPPRPWAPPPPGGGPGGGPPPPPGGKPTKETTAALAAGRPVFVDFTADWCITCKVNERGVLADERVMAAFAERGVELLIADWTQRDDTIAAELARFGKAGVPLYVLHVPGADTAPIVLPELLTIDRVFAELSSLPSP